MIVDFTANVWTGFPWQKKWIDDKDGRIAWASW